MSQVPGQDPAFMEAIQKHMRVPERLSVGTGQQWRRDEEEESSRRKERFPSAVTMQVPDRLTYTEAPDMSPSPLFSPTKLTLGGPLSLDPSWENSQGEVFIREALQSPIRRSYSDQSFGRTPPGTPTPLRQTLSLPRQPSNLRSSGRPFLQRSLPHTLSSNSQTAKTLGLQATQRLLQAVSQKYRFRNQEKPPAARLTGEGSAAAAQVELSKRRLIDGWNSEEDAGAAVEFIILRRQVIKMSRRLAALERHSAERRNAELVLFSLLLSACVLNVWLWIRR
ncbi:mitochondrial fission factor homolog B-like isoform X3 [Halichoeres trimaculatus]|uniref:mitochondrial fission factor homolog B-like isoform X3 n=1 Tax=Halichoeres trimaculatus TaxID=147232 RepID=UPI003D9E8A2A